MAWGGKHATWMAAGVLFFCNIVVGLLFINEGIFHYDGIVLAQCVEKIYQTGILQPAVQGRYGSVFIGMVTYFPFFWLGQNADFAIRFTSVLFHALSIVAFFAFIRALFSNQVQAFLGALLLSFIPFYFSPDTYGKEHGMSVFFLLVSFYFLYRGVQRKRVFWIVAAGLCYLFSVSIRESVLLTVPLLVLLFFQPTIMTHPLRIVIPEGRFKRDILFWLIPALLIIFGAMWFSYFGNALWHQMLIRPSTSTVIFRGLFTWIISMAGYNLLSSIPVIFFVLVVFGIWGMWRKGEFLWTVFFLLWSMTILCYGNTSGYAPRHLDQVAIPLCVFAAYALARMYEKYKVGSVLIALYCTLSMFLFLYPMLSFRHHYNGEKQLALFLKSVTEANAVILTADDAPFIDYYGHRKTLFLPTSDWGRWDSYTKTVKEYLAQKIPVYFTEAEYILDYDFLSILEERGFRLSLVGYVLSEDFHRPELNFCFRNQRVFKVSLK